MVRKHHEPEKVITKLRQIKVLVGRGKPVAEGVRAIGVTEGTYYRWRPEGQTKRPNPTQNTGKSGKASLA